MCSSDSIISVGMIIPLAAATPATCASASLPCSRKVLTYGRPGAWAWHPTGVLLVLSGALLVLEGLVPNGHRGTWVVAPIAAANLLTGLQTLQSTSGRFAMTVQMAIGITIAFLAQAGISVLMPRVCGSSSTPSTSMMEIDALSRLWSGETQAMSQLLALASLVLTAAAWFIAVGGCAAVPSVRGALLGVHERGVNEGLMLLLARRKHEMERVLAVRDAVVDYAGLADAGSLGAKGATVRQRRSMAVADDVEDSDRSTSPGGRSGSGVSEGTGVGGVASKPSLRKSRMPRSADDDNNDDKDEGEDARSDDDEDDQATEAALSSKGSVPLRACGLLGAAGGSPALSPTLQASLADEESGSWRQMRQIFVSSARSAAVNAAEGAFRDWILRTAARQGGDEETHDGSPCFVIADLGCGGGEAAAQMLQRVEASTRQIQDGGEATKAEADSSDSRAAPALSLVRLVGVDFAGGAVRRAREALKPWAARDGVVTASVVKADVCDTTWLDRVGESGEGQVDLVLLLWTLDGMGAAAASKALEQAHRALRRHSGVLLVACGSLGATPAADAAADARVLASRLCPSAVGGHAGLEPLELIGPETGWRVRGWQHITQSAYTTAVIVATKL